MNPPPDILYFRARRSTEIESLWEDLHWEEQRRILLESFDTQALLVDHIASEKKKEIFEIAPGVLYEEVFVSICGLSKVKPPYVSDRSFRDLVHCLLGHACEEEAALFHFESLSGLFGDQDRAELMAKTIHKGFSRSKLKSMKRREKKKLEKLKHADLMTQLPGVTHHSAGTSFKKSQKNSLKKL